ncbi:MAG: hypothetical protein V1885_03355 [Candidatus Brennerbacteria bacterium]
MLKESFEHVLEFFSEFFKKEEVWALLLFVGFGVWIIYAFFDALWEILVNFFRYAWPIILFFVVLPLLSSLWLFIRQAQYKEAMKWVLLEIRIPREVKKSPQGMEQVLAAIHSLRNAAGDIKEKYWEGEVTRWYTLEMVSFGGEIRFFIRVYKGQVKLVQSSLFSYYPDVEIAEVEDYMSLFPQTVEEMYESKRDLWGTEMILTKPAAYPIKTYEDFENLAEEKQFDPISTFLEILGNIKKEETVAIHILVAPAGAGWGEKYEDVVEDLKTPKTVIVGGDAETEGREVPISHSEVHKDVLKIVEENLSKPAFDTIVRFVYLSPKEGFSDTFPRRGLAGAFNQYSALNLNGFRQNHKVGTRTRIWNKPYVFPKIRLEYRKQRMLHWIRKREIPPETWMGKFMTSYFFCWNFGSKRFLLNTKSVATLFHPPTSVVLTAPHIKRVESRRAGPPAGLAIFGEEKDIERFG